MLKNTLQNDQIKALKAGQAKELEILRYILSQIKNKEIEKQAELTDEETLMVIKKIAKDLNKSSEAFKRGERQDLVDQNESQLKIVKKYLPVSL